MRRKRDIFGVGDVVACSDVVLELDSSALCFEVAAREDSDIVGKDVSLEVVWDISRCQLMSGDEAEEGERWSDGMLEY